MAMIISPNGVAITERFFKAIDALTTSGVFRGLQTFTRSYDINRWNLQHVRQYPEKTVLKPELLAILVSDFNLSAEWLLTGQGSMFKGDLLPQPKKKGRQSKTGTPSSLPNETTHSE